MYFFREYTKPNKDPSKTDKITRIYNNYSACKCCIHKNNCFTDKQTHRTITENGERMQRAMHHKMEKEEYKEEFSKRSYAEGPFGIFKEQFHIEQEIVIGVVKTEERLNIDALAYNIKRLYNLKQEKNNNKEDIIDFCESIATKNQLELNVTIT